MSDYEADAWHMARALELAARGEGLVESNPMVGCTIVRDGETVGEGFHQRFGGPHAEIEAITVAASRAAGATAYVTLEPCCHQGKTPPCTQALIEAGVRRVVVAMRDPFPQVAGRGLAELETAGIAVEVGLGEPEARDLNAPYLKLVTTGRPWIIAKWAMTLDGKLATSARDSRWISCETSRAIVHRLRGRVDAIIVGRGTAEADDPLLTARPPGPRTAARIVFDSQATLSPDRQLVRTAREVPLIVAVAASAPTSARDALTSAGCEVLVCPGDNHATRLAWLLDELGRRRMTNVLVEGGSRLFGELFDAGHVDEVHAFIAPKIVGGHNAPSPVGAAGVELMAQALALTDPRIEPSGDDVYIRGRIARASSPD
jgi:diaminohydroxyphosphoribosylaminopyrimidine deaminase / 5-amino-6-(5-phosphoribosylamino)uracil reductase